MRWGVTMKFFAPPRGSTAYVMAKFPNLTIRNKKKTTVPNVLTFYVMTSNCVLPSS